jgi:hypothetical protein
MPGTEPTPCWIFIARSGAGSFSSKFALSAISLTGTFGILLLGGWLIPNGRSDVGTVVASLTG